MKMLPVLIFCGLLSSAVQAQVAPEYISLSKDSTTHKVAYYAIRQTPGVARAELVSRAQLWSARAFVGPGLYIISRTEDAPTGLLAFRASLQNPGPENNYSFTVTIQVKDGRYKYLVDQISRTWGVISGGKWAAGPITKPMEYFGESKLNKGQRAELLNFDSRIRELITGLEKAMAEQGKDW